MITIWGRATSSNVQLVMWAVAELGLEHERINAGGMHGGLDTPEYLAMNPNGLIPVIRDGEAVVWESCAILRYLAARYGDEVFWPADPVARARLDMWAEWAKLNVASTFTTGIFWQLVRTPEAKRDMDAVRATETRLKALMPLLDVRLGAGPWLGGGELSFADIVIGHFLYRYYDLSFDRAATPNIDAYYARLTERPAFAEHVMVSYESLRAL